VTERHRPRRRPGEAAEAHVAEIGPGEAAEAHVAEIAPADAAGGDANHRIARSGLRLGDLVDAYIPGAVDVHLLHRVSIPMGKRSK
jgi:hypothetical protein